MDSRGLLTLGWHGPDSAVLQDYSGPASPYWASKGFLGLLLPPGHPVWTAAEEPGPAERSDALTAISAPNWLLQSTSSDGVVRLHNHGSEDVRYDPYYTRLAYSTVTEPSSSYDNSVIVGDDPSRTDIEPLGVGEGWVASRHTAGGGARVTTVVLARGAVEVRAHLVAGAEPWTPVRVTGWATEVPRASGSESGGGTAYGPNSYPPWAFPARSQVSPARGHRLRRAGTADRGAGAGAAGGDGERTGRRGTGVDRALEWRTRGSGPVGRLRSGDRPDGPGVTRCPPRSMPRSEPRSRRRRGRS